MLIQQLSATFQQSTARFYRALYESLLDSRLVTSSKHAMFLNLLFRALKSDTNAKRVMAFVKRLLQIATLHQPPFVCGILYLLHELKISLASIKTMLDQPEGQEAEDEENFQDVPEGLDQRQDIADPVDPNDFLYEKRQPEHHVYDGRKRDPAHSSADKSCLWELVSQTLLHYADCPC